MRLGPLSDFFSRFISSDAESMKHRKIHHYFYRDDSGTVHVDTMIDGERWQHHVHSEGDFARWSDLMGGTRFIRLPDGTCACDLKPGQVLEHDGRIRNHPQFV